MSARGSEGASPYGRGAPACYSRGAARNASSDEHTTAHRPAHAMSCGGLLACGVCARRIAEWQARCKGGTYCHPPHTGLPACHSTHGADKLEQTLSLNGLEPPSILKSSPPSSMPRSAGVLVGFTRSPSNTNRTAAGWWWQCSCWHQLPAAGGGGNAAAGTRCSQHAALSVCGWLQSSQQAGRPNSSEQSKAPHPQASASASASTSASTCRTLV